MFSVTEQLRPDLHQEDTTKIIRHSKSYNYYYNDQYIYIKQFKCLRHRFYGMIYNICNSKNSPISKLFDFFERIVCNTHDLDQMLDIQTKRLLAVVEFLLLILKENIIFLTPFFGKENGD